MWPSNSASIYILKRIENSDKNLYLYPIVHCSINNSKGGKKQVSINRMDKQNVV